MWSETYLLVTAHMMDQIDQMGQVGQIRQLTLGEGFDGIPVVVSNNRDDRINCSDESLDVPSGTLSRTVRIVGRYIGRPVALYDGLDVAFECVAEGGTVVLVPPSGVSDTLLNMFGVPLRNDNPELCSSTLEMYLAKILLAVSAYEVDADFQKTNAMIGWARYSRSNRRDVCARACMKLVDLLNREGQNTERMLDAVTASKAHRIIKIFDEMGEFIENGQVNR